MSHQFSLFDAPSPSPSSQTEFNYGRDLSPQQAKVRDHGAGNQVVVAGAGTGKTEALTQRILKLLVEGDGNGPIELEAILALTFTDKGAAEMRGRVYARLVEILRDLPRGEHRARLERIRANFAENHRILTFDAFSFRLLGQFPDISPLMGETQVLDGGVRRQMRREVTRQFWNRVETTFSDAQKRELWQLLEVFPSRRAALEAIYRLAEAETEDQLRIWAVLPPADEWREEFATLVSRDGERMWRALETEVERLNLDFALKNELLDAERILAGGRSGLVTQKDWSADFKKRWSPELLPGMERVGRKIREWKQEVETPRDPELDWRSRCAVAALASHALWWQGAQREWCTEKGVASFSDIAGAALEMIRNPVVAAQVRAGFSHVLIDEFQDTNWRQWALLDALRDTKEGNVLVVGDEKQAIFRFRGGDITVFDGVRRILLGSDVDADELTVSRRSTRQLVGWTNTVFREVLPSSEARQPFEAPFQALQSETENLGNGLWKILPADWHGESENSGEAMSAASQRERAARALARFLRSLCDDAQNWEKSESPQLQFPDLALVSRKIARGENAIGVVFTTHEVKSVFEAQLRAYDVPFVAVKGTGFWGSDPVTWTLQLLQIWLDGHDQSALVGLARSPFGGLSDVALLEWHLALQSAEERDENSATCFNIAGFAPSRADDARAWEIFVARLQKWRDLARVEAASEVLESVLEESELAFYEAGLPDAAQREQNWHKILDLLREREDAGEGGLRALIDHLSGLVREASDGEKEADAPLPAGGSIQLMTVFASKGLGFPMTILAQLDGAPQNKGSLLLRGTLEGEKQMAFRLCDDDEDEKNAPKPWLWEKLRAQDGAEEDAQWRRLFYVACTRAESHLVLVCPENQPRNGAAWTNLCIDAQREMSAIRPVDALPVERGREIPVAQRPEPMLAPLSRAAPSEIALGDIAGARAEKFASQARQWIENHLGTGAEIREEIPFFAPTAALHIENPGWIVGAWEWIAPLESEAILLAATGENRDVAVRRATLMRLAAENAGFAVGESWALWPCGEQTEAERLG